MSTAVRWSVTSTRALPVMGWIAAKMFAVASRVYSSSTRSGTGARRNRLSSMADELFAGLVQANDESRRVVGQMVDVEHVLHRGYGRSALVGRDAEALDSPA